VWCELIHQLGQELAEPGGQFITAHSGLLGKLIERVAA